MKEKTLAFLLPVLMIFTMNNAGAVLAPVIWDSAKVTQEAVTTQANEREALTVQRFLILTPGQYQEQTGKKMNVFSKLALRRAQCKVKRLLKKGSHVDMNTVNKSINAGEFHLIGFLLGLVLGPIGVLLAYLLRETGHLGGNSVTWAWIGFLVWLVFVVLIF